MNNLSLRTEGVVTYVEPVRKGESDAKYLKNSKFRGDFDE